MSSRVNHSLSIVAAVRMLRCCTSTLSVTLLGGLQGEGNEEYTLAVLTETQLSLRCLLDTTRSCVASLSVFFFPLDSPYSAQVSILILILLPSRFQICFFFNRSSCIDIDLFFFNLEELLLSVIKAIVESMALWSLSPRV